MSEEKKDADSITLEKKKLASMGPDTVLIIPRILIKHKIIDPNKKYDIIFIESQDQENHEKE